MQLSKKTLCHIPGCPGQYGERIISDPSGLIPYATDTCTTCKKQKWTNLSSSQELGAGVVNYEK